MALPNFQGEKSRARCTAHISNLIAKVRIYDALFQISVC